MSSSLSGPRPLSRYVKLTCMRPSLPVTIFCEPAFVPVYSTL